MCVLDDVEVAVVKAATFTAELGSAQVCVLEMSRRSAHAALFAVDRFGPLFESPAVASLG